MEKFKFNIQLFGGTGEPEGEKDTGATEPTYKLEDVLGNQEIMQQILQSDAVKGLIQSETDKVRTKAAQEKQAKLSEFAQYKEQTDKTIAELKAFQTNYLKTEVLKKTGLDTELWDYVSGETQEDILKNAENLKKLIDLKAQEKAGTKLPESDNDFKGVTKEQFGKMSYAEKAELYQNNKELYLELIK